MTQIEHKPYHHGYLPSALLEAVAKLVNEKGIENLTLREIARRAGVSQSAPAHHFGDKAGLITAFAIEGFERLRTHMETRRVEAGKEPFARMAAVGEAYLEFAIDHPAHFRVMFRTELLNAQDPQYIAANRAAYQVLKDSLAAGDQIAGNKVAGNKVAGNKVAGNEQENTFEQRCLLAWSAVHGFATLWLEGALEFKGTSRKSQKLRAAELGKQVLTALGPALFGTAQAVSNHS